MADAHVGENAELYALGLLDSAERDRVDAHVATCDACLRLVGGAEETVLALEREAALVALPPRAPAAPFSQRAAPWWVTLLAAAAAFILGFVLPHRPPANDSALLAMVNAHFNHAQFSGAGPAAKVLYARDRSWYYVIVSSSRTYSVVGVRNGVTTPLGSTSPSGATSELFTRPGRLFDRIELREGSGVSETAQIR